MTTDPMLVPLDDEDRELLRRRFRIDKEIKLLAGERDLIDARLKDLAGNAEAGVIGKTVVFTYTPVVSRVLDQKALKEHEPDVVDLYTVERITRPFRVTKEAAEVLG